MKVTLSLVITQIALAAIAVPEDTVVGNLRVSILSADRTTVVATKDIDDSQMGGSQQAVFEGILAGSYVAVAQRLTGDANVSNLGSPSELAFDVADVGGGTPPAPKTFGQPSGLSVLVEVDAGAVAA